MIQCSLDTSGGGIFKNSTYAYSPFLIVHITFATITIFLIGGMVDLTRQYMEKQAIEKWLDMLLETDCCKKIKERISRGIHVLERM